MKWQTKDGRMLSISDISDSHLLNINNMLERNGFVHSSVALSCLAYSATAPDGAAMAAESAFESMKFNDVSDAIFDEVDRRGLLP
jgi:hypothetical protein